MAVNLYGGAGHCLSGSVISRGHLSHTHMSIYIMYSCSIEGIIAHINKDGELRLFTALFKPAEHYYGVCSLPQVSLSFASHYHDSVDGGSLMPSVRGQCTV